MAISNEEQDCLFFIILLIVVSFPVFPLIPYWTGLSYLLIQRSVPHKGYGPQDWLNVITMELRMGAKKGYVKIFTKVGFGW
jgi:hypothetical protein